MSPDVTRSASAAKYRSKRGEERGGETARADYLHETCYSVRQVVDLSERKTNNWDDNEVPVATNGTQSIRALWDQ